jgi:hypothetical protein
MAVIINGSFRINSNGSININTDPAFGITTTTTTTTSTTTTTTTINLDDFACMSGAPDPLMNGTYVNSFIDVTEQGFTRPIFSGPNGYYLRIVSGPGGPSWGLWYDGEFYFAGTTKPIPQYPWQSAWSDGVTVTRGLC